MSLYGPFHGNGQKFFRDSKPVNGTIDFKPETEAIRALAEYLVLSQSQLSILTGVKNAKTLFEKGLLDEYRSESSPAIYALSHKSCCRLELKYQPYDTIQMLRLVASNQLWLHLRNKMPNAKWDLSEAYPHISVGDIRFYVAAPRATQADNIYAYQAYNFLHGKNRLIIVASCQEQALDIASQSEQNQKIVRYTWDTELKSDASLYLYHGGKLIKAG